MPTCMGRPRHFKSPDEIQAAFDEYVKWAADNPWHKQDFIRGGDSAGQIVYLEIERPLTEVEFAVFCGLSLQGYLNYLNRPEFVDIIRRVKSIMSAQRISGGVTGAFNGNLIARMDGLVEKTAIEHSGTLSIAEQIERAHKPDSSKQQDEQPTG
jgi:hypothetical protein